MQQPTHQHRWLLAHTSSAVSIWANIVELFFFLQQTWVASCLYWSQICPLVSGLQSGERCMLGKTPAQPLLTVLQRCFHSPPPIFPKLCPDKPCLPVCNDFWSNRTWKRWDGAQFWGDKWRGRKAPLWNGAVHAGGKRQGTISSLKKRPFWKNLV